MDHYRIRLDVVDILIEWVG